jgi:hypothetical protein
MRCQLHRIHNGRTICAALAAFKGNIYKKHIYTYVNCPISGKQKYIYLKGLPNKKFSYVVANSDQNSKGQGPREDCLMKKNEGRKSRDTVPLIQLILTGNTLAPRGNLNQLRQLMVKETAVTEAGLITVLCTCPCLGKKE